MQPGHRPVTGGTWWTSASERRSSTGRKGSKHK